MIYKIKFKLIIISAFCILMQSFSFAYKSRQPVDIVYTLDLSGSTNGLIDDVRDKMFELSNKLHHLRPSPDVRVGIVGYGRPSFGAKNQYVKVLCPLTSDIDFVAAALYKLKPNIEKGDQFVGAAIKHTIEELDWIETSNALRIVYLAGNGNVSTGPVDFRRWSAEAKARGIILNPVYCLSSLREKEIAGWAEIAENSGGQLFEMKIRFRLPDFVTVKDFERLAQLSTDLNNTYIGYGNSGSSKQKQITGNLKNAYISGQACFEAMIYHQISDRFLTIQDEWDLVDYYFSPRGSLVKLTPQDLPKHLRNYDHITLKAYLQSQKEARLKIVKELRELLPYQRQDKANEFANQFSSKNKEALENIVVLSLKESLNNLVNNSSIAISSARESTLSQKEAK